jgi:hypothetical protein
MSIWPQPDKLFDWFADANLSRDSQTAVLAVAAGAIRKAYTEWHGVHHEASAKIVELLQDAQDTTMDKVDGALKVKIKRLEKDLGAARDGG